MHKDDLWPLSLTLAIAKMLLTKNGEHSWEEVSPERIAVINEMVSASWIHQVARINSGGMILCIT
jgi:hypothetical protein